MCGIFGGFLPSSSAKAIGELGGRAQKILKHRGPDSWGLSIHNAFWVGMTRLAIVDIKSGNQPIHSNDGQVSIVFNGEIYNFKHLREELQKDGYRFQSQSDTEVILQGYLANGEDIFRHLNGIFAIAILDRRTNKLVLARDPMGVKPLYFWSDGQNFIFGSETKIMTGLGFSRQVDRRGLLEYFQSTYVFSPGTAIKNVAQLEPGHYMEVTSDGVHAAKKFRALAQYRPDKKHTLDSAATVMLEALEVATCNQTMGDVDFGLLLSGGLDSMLILELLRKNGKADRLPVFSAYYGASTYDEIEDVKYIADSYGLKLHMVKVDGAFVLENLDALCRTFDNLEFLPTCASIFAASKIAAKECKFVLSGVGGDELVFGYPTYAATQLLAKTRGLMKILAPIIGPFLKRTRRTNQYLSLGERLERFLQGAHLPLEAAHLSWRTGMHHDLVVELLRSWDVAPVVTILLPQLKKYQMAEAGGFKEFNKFSYVDFHNWLTDCNLMIWDKAGMASSLEIRVPLLDLEVLRVLEEIPWKILTYGGVGSKGFMRYLGRNLYHPRIAKLRKKGFQAPIADWLRFKPLGDAMQERTYDLPREIFNKDKIESMWRMFFNGWSQYALPLWLLGMLSGWVKQNEIDF